MSIDGFLMVLINCALMSHMMVQWSNERGSDSLMFDSGSSMALKMRLEWIGARTTTSPYAMRFSAYTIQKHKGLVIFDVCSYVISA